MGTLYTAVADNDMQSLRWAYRHLEHPSFAARLSNVIGTPIERGMDLLPGRWHQRLHDAVEVSLLYWLNYVIRSMEHIPTQGSHDALHKFMAFGTGAASGFFGPLTMLAELPVTTGMMLRSIADVAHAQGEDLSQPDARMACMQVFALSGRTPEDKAAETGYYGMRLTLGFHFSSKLLHAGNNVPVHNIPGGIELVRAIAARFSIVISDSAAVKMVPIVGAISGALINLAFMQHFQDVARGHFIVRRLERQYGSEVIQAAYKHLRSEEKKKRRFNPVEGW